MNLDRIAAHEGISVQQLFVRASKICREPGTNPNPSRDFVRWKEGGTTPAYMRSFVAYWDGLHHTGTPQTRYA